MNPLRKCLWGISALGLGLALRGHAMIVVGCADKRAFCLMNS